MKLAFVTINGQSWGGSEMLWTQTAMLALRQKHEVLASVFDWPEQPPAIRMLSEKGAKLVTRRRFYPALPQRLKKRALNMLMPAGMKTTYHDYLKQFRADRILFNLGGGSEIAEDESDLMLFTRQTKIPYFIFCHSISVQGKIFEPVRRNMIESFAKARKVFFSSHLQIQLLEEQLREEIPNAYRMNHPLQHVFSKPLSFPSGEAIHFAMVGSLTCRWKGQDVAIRILSEQPWRERNWVLNIYGKGEDEQYLKKLVADHMLEANVVFHGYCADHEKIWSDNHVLLVASQQDSGPITVFEAMNAGRPVIGTRMGVMPEYVHNNRTGMLAKSTKAAHLAEAMEEAWKQKQQWKHWGEEAHLFLKRHYDFQAADTLLTQLING